MRIVSGTLKPTPNPWLPVLSNIVPQHIRREDATTALLNKITANPSIPARNDIIYPPKARLPSRHPIWSFTQPTASAAERWKSEWFNGPVTNGHLVSDPTTRQPGFTLPRRLWSSLNHFRTGQGLCGANRVKWGLGGNEHCRCGGIQTMSHIVEQCPLTKLEGGLLKLHSAGDDAVQWLDRYKR